MSARSAHRYELIGCAWNGHILVGTDAASVGPEHARVVVERAGSRWHRCLRCDGWYERRPPAQPARSTPPPDEELPRPLRGAALRDRYVLRLIALERGLHVVAFAALAVAIFVFAAHRASVQAEFTRVVNALYGASGSSGHGFVATLRHLFFVSPRHLEEAGLALSAYAVLEAVECVGLWRGRRWAEYLTFIATVCFVPFEVYELTSSLSAVKIVTLVLNIVIALYLLLSKRLFGLRGGAQAAERHRTENAGAEQAPVFVGD